MSGNTTRGHFPAPRSRWSFTCSRWVSVFSAQGVGGVLLGSIRSLLKANRGASCGRSFGQVFPSTPWRALAALLLWHLSKEGDSS